ncbi:hypothetical protein BV22DRAFT_786055 [Leucogyrophana mollusca]|uniref:Uncharacterized protein n=1 Tax=Leucogyrophana mollusca TaxID=85980 RepID=A0ACB8B4P1_9AGAM|nr:hypothetical protein BV22DRAFT_786055 [Leucogyrophana mollusca]
MDPSQSRNFKRSTLGQCIDSSVGQRPKLLSPPRRRWLQHAPVPCHISVMIGLQPSSMRRKTLSYGSGAIGAPKGPVKTIATLWQRGVIGQQSIPHTQIGYAAVLAFHQYAPAQRTYMGRVSSEHR